MLFCQRFESTDEGKVPPETPLAHLTMSHAARRLIARHVVAPHVGLADGHPFYRLLPGHRTHPAWVAVAARLGGTFRPIRLGHAQLT